MPTIAKRLESLPPYVFSVIGDRIRAMQKDDIEVLRLDIGNPDLPPPDNVIEKLYESAQRADKHGYTGYRGLASFRQAVARYYKQRFDVNLDPDTEVLPVLGSKEGIVNLAIAYIDAGDTVLIPDIGYPSYEMGTRLAGGDIQHFHLSPEYHYLPDLSTIPESALATSKILWVNYPNNPTGAMADLNFYRNAVSFCREHDLVLASDAPYVEVKFDDCIGYSALQGQEDKSNVVEFMSFSKSFNMAGWRLGAAVGDTEVIANLLRVKSNIDSGHFAAIYEAGILALETPKSWIDARNATYQKRRDKIVSTLQEIGLSIDEPPKGSLYVWAKVEHISSVEYVEKALTEARVSIAPGDAYGPGGAGFVRISIAVADDILDKALQQLKVWYSEIKQNE